MSNGSKQQVVEEHLRAEGYVPTVDGDGDLVFKVEGRSYHVLFDADDPDYFQMVFPNFWSIENEDEREKVVLMALDATKNTKAAKVYPVRDNTWAAVELFCATPEAFNAVFPRALGALRAAVATFVDKMREAKAG